MVQDTGRRAEVVRDLKGQIAELTAADAGEVVFIDVSPGRQRVTLYSMETGEPISIPAYMVEGVMQRRLAGGGYAFTSEPAKAPEYKLGDVKCFLHPESPDRHILQEIGLGYAFCPAAHLPNDYEKRIHAQHRHRKQWEAYQHHLNSQKQKQQEERQERQVEATLAMARAAGGSPVATAEPAIEFNPQPAATLIAESADADKYTCACGYKPPSDSKRPDTALRMHKRYCKAG